MARLIWRLTALTAGVSVISCGVIAPAYAAPEAESQSVRIINVNDFHGRIDTPLTEQFAQTIEDLRDESAGESVFLSAGDNIGASLFNSSSQQDTPTLEVMNALGLDASAVGNHEFDRGIDDLTGRVSDEADFPHLAANVSRTDGSLPLEPYTIIERDGLRIGVIGVVTEETPSLVLASGVAGLEFSNPVQAVNKYAAELKDGNEDNGEADIVIAEYHEGASAGTPDGATLDEEIAAGGAFAEIVNGTGAEVDAIFTGHTHKEYIWEDANGRPIVQTGSYAGNIGVLDLSVNDEEVSVDGVQLRPTSATEVPEQPGEVVQNVREIVDAAIAKADEIGGVEVGESTAPITTAFSTNDEGVLARDDRSSESTMGHTVATMYRDSLADAERGGAEIGIVNPGGLRDDWREAGTLTIRDVVGVTPFANNLWSVDLSGAQLKAVLEEQWQPEGNSRPYLQLGLSDNVRYTYNPDAARGEHITGVWIDDAEVRDDQVIRVALPSFLKDGGDNFFTFADSTNPKDSGLVDSDAFQDWVEANSPVAPDYRRQAIPLTETEVEGGVQVNIDKIDLTSLESPVNTEAQVLFTPVADAAPTVQTFAAPAAAGTPIEGATLPVEDGALDATILASEQSLEAGEYRVQLRFAESGTVVDLASKLQVAAAGDGGNGGGQGDGGNGASGDNSNTAGTADNTAAGSDSSEDASLAATGQSSMAVIAVALLMLLAGAGAFMLRRKA